MKVLKNEKHFTTSVWLVTKSKPQKVLLVFHRKFNLWIQPGGHIEKFENPIEAAIRETYEETGLDISFIKKKIINFDVSSSLPVPKFVLEEKIPPYKDQPEHFHIDFMYVVKINEQDPKLNKQESKDIRFFTGKEALKLPVHEDTRFIIQRIVK